MKASAGKPSLASSVGMECPLIYHEMFHDHALYLTMVRKITSILSLLLLTVSAAFPQDTQVDSDLKFGLELFKNKMYDLAEEQLSKFLQQYPTSPSAGQARYYLAMSQYDQNKFPNAATNFQAFAVQYPTDPLAPTAWTNAGDSYEKVEDYANAALSYERLQVFYSKDPRAPGALLKSAKYFELSGDTARAEISLLTVVQDYSTTPTYFDATLQLGNLYFNSQQIAKAENEYKALLSSDNDSVRVMGLLALGRLNKMRGMPLQAAKYFEDASRLNIAPQSVDALLESIELDLETGNFTSALERANQIDATNLSQDQKDKIEYEKGYARLALGDNAAFKNEIPKLRTLPAEYRIQIASLLKARRRYSDGLSFLRNLSPKDANESTLSLYAELAFRGKRTKLADSLLNALVDLSKAPSVTRVAALLTLEDRSLKNEEGVRQTFYRYQNVLKERPDAFLFYRARVEEGDGNYEEAVRDLQELATEYPESDYAAYADSISNYISNFKNVNYRNAVSGLAGIVSEQAMYSGHSTAALLQLGNLFENELKDYDKAARIYRQLSLSASGDTQRVAQYLLAGNLEMTSGRNDNRHSNVADVGSESYSIYQKLSSSLANDSISENSLLRVIEMQSAAGDSVDAENSALNFLKRFPNSNHAGHVYCMLAKILYSTGAYHEAIVQAGLAGSLPEAQLVKAQSETAIDSLSAARSILEDFFNSRPPKKYLLEGQLLYAGILQKMNEDALGAYLNILKKIVSSKYKDKIESQLADYLYSTGQYDSSYSIYRMIGKDELWHETPAEVIYRMAYCKLKSAALNDARDLFQEVVINSPDSSEIQDAYFQLGKIYDALGDKRMSASFFEKAGLNDMNALVKAAETFFKMADYESARQTFGKILGETNVDTLRAFSAARLIEIDYLTDDIKSADAAAAKFKKAYPGNDDEYLARFLVDKAEYLIRNKSYKQAQKNLDEVKSDYDETSIYPISLLDQARISVEVGDLKKAQEQMTELLQKFPGSPAAPAAHLELGNIYFAQEKYQDAIDNFRTIYLDSLADRDLLRDAMSRLISSYESAGLYDGALEVTRKFIGKFPDDKSITDMRIKVGILYEELKYFDQALIAFQSLVKETNRDYQAELHYYIGAIYDDKGDYANAILEFLKVPYLISQNAVVDWAAQAYYMAGKCYEQLNKPNEAIAMYQKIVDKPNTDPTFVAGAEREINRVKALLK